MEDDRKDRGEAGGNAAKPSDKPKTVIPPFINPAPPPDVDPVPKLYVPIKPIEEF